VNNKLSEKTGYNKKLRPFASKLRKEMTKSESCLWKYDLKSGKMCGYHFRRQRSVLKYIADFMSVELKLVIELDGATHMLDDVIEKDIKKQKDLENAGFIVMRFTDNEVLTGIEGVAEKIKEKILEITKK
jgi:very-short-patch-repair endonuclease